MSDPLVVSLHDAPVASLRRRRADDLELHYEASYAESRGAVPVSTALPLAQRVHRGERVWNFVDNLLPDNPDVRERWATRAGLTSADVFALISHYGQDVAGAVAFHPEATRAGGSREPLSEAAVAERIRAARADSTAWHDDDRPADGQFSLGGAQTKFSLAKEGDSWFEATGAEPSTHIFKPQVNRVPDGEIVEFVVMRTARELGIATAHVDLATFDDEHSLVVERFDRRLEGGIVTRVHQEDFAQSLGVARLHKYERDGGPSSETMAKHLRDHGGTDDGSRARFATMLAYSWIVLNSDAHTKNYSTFVDADGIRLTPLYDASSLVPYLGETGTDHASVLARSAGRTLAMRYGASYRVGDIGGFELGAIARSCGMSATELLDIAATYCLAIPGLVEDIAHALPARFQTATVQRLVDWMPLRTRQAIGGLTGHL